MSRRRSLAGAGRELEAPVAELDDRDRGEVRALERRIGLDVALDEASASASPADGAFGQEGGQQVARLVAQAAAGAAVEDEVGEGSDGHLERDCRRGAATSRPRTADRPPQGGAAAMCQVTPDARVVFPGRVGGTMEAAPP